MKRQRGLSLLELLVVLAIISFAIAGISLSLRDSRQSQLEHEAQRLVATLEAARAQSRTSGIALIWQATPEGFVIRPSIEPNPTQNSNAPTPLSARSETWLAAGTLAIVSSPFSTQTNLVPSNLVILGPEPILAPARITLNVATVSNANPTAPISIGTDGLRPFQVVP